MDSRAKLLGHPVHPMLVVFPLGLLGTAVVFDIAHLATRNGYWAGLAFWLITVGLIGGLLAGVFGFRDWLAIPRGTRAKAIGAWHGGGNLVVLVLFAVSWILRRPAPGEPPLAAFVLGLAGLGLASVTAWLGGELVHRLGVSVDSGAHLNSPNALSGRPAMDTDAPPGHVRPVQQGG